MTSIQEFGGLGNSNQMEVSFSPHEGPRGSQYIATVADKEQDGTTAIELNKQKIKKLKPSGFYNGDHIKGFFFGSVSAIALYILFRMLQKSK